MIPFTKLAPYAMSARELDAKIYDVPFTLELPRPEYADIPSSK